MLNFQNPKREFHSVPNSKVYCYISFYIHIDYSLIYPSSSILFYFPYSSANRRIKETQPKQKEFVPHE